MNERGFGKWSNSVCGSSLRGNCIDGSLLGTPKTLRSEALELDVSFHRGPILGNMGGRSSLMALHRDKIILEIFYRGI